MILVAIALFSALSFVCFIYIDNKRTNVILTILSVIGLLISCYFGIINWHDHYGLEQYTTTTTRQIYSVSPSKQMPMLLYQPIGSADKHQVYIYKPHADVKKPTHTQADTSTKNKVTRITGTTRMVTKTTRWRYSSNAAEFWFIFTGENHKLVRRTNTLQVNHKWLVLTTAQAKTLQKQMKSKTYQAKLKQTGEAYVKAQVMAAMKKDPTMSKADQAKLIKQAEAAFKAQAMQKLINSLQAK